MKFIFSSFLATLASVSAKRDLAQRDLQFTDPALLKSRWEMADANIQYNDSTDVFTITFDTASAENYDAGLEESFWGPGCMPTDSSSIPQGELPAGLVTDDVNTGNPPELKMVGGKPTMTLKISPVAFSNNAFSYPGTYSLYPGSAEVNFCIRSSLGYTATPSDGQNTGTDVSFGSGYQEVNFIETLVRVSYTMEGGFTVDAFQVEPKEKFLLTVSETFDDAIEAYLCIGSNHPDFDVNTHVRTVLLSDNSQIQMPKPLTEYNAEKINPGGLSTPAGPSKFNQGALINVCVKVKDAYIPQGIRLNKITSFDWLREDANAYDQDVSGFRDGDGIINQEAIVSSGPSNNYLTSYVPSDCVNTPVCDFASVLFAQFYNTDGVVSGSGNANLMFNNRRRLGESNDGRQLQEDPGSAGMDIAVDVNGIAEGPGDMKTAGGASVTAVFASVIALVGAALLA